MTLPFFIHTIRQKTFACCKKLRYFIPQAAKLYFKLAHGCSYAARTKTARTPDTFAAD
jgi:hypothetical protein